MDILPLFPNQKTEPSPTYAATPTVEPAPLEGLNLLRVMAAGGVVLLHASVPYLQNSMPGLDWPVRESGSLWIDSVFWSIEIFIMPVFLLVAGILAWQTASRRGPKALLISRTKRLGKPLLFGLCVILPIDLYLWVGGWVFEGWVDPIKLKSFKIDGPLGENLWGTSHLWFLLYLMTYVACFALVIRWWNPKDQKVTIGGTTSMKRPWRSLASCLLLLIGVVTLWCRPEVVWGFQHDFLPVPSKWIYSATYFVGGVLIASHREGLVRLQKQSLRLAAPSIVCLFAALLLGRWDLHESTSSHAASQITLAALTTLAAWGITLSSTGLFTRYIQSTSAIVSYLATASFWVYLVHHPFVALAHIDLKYLLPTVSVELKWGLSFLLSMTASLMTYEAFIRKTKFGKMLGLNWSLLEKVNKEPILVTLPEPENSPAEMDRRAA